MEELRTGCFEHGWRSSYKRADMPILIFLHTACLSHEVMLSFAGSGMKVTWCSILPSISPSNLPLTAGGGCTEIPPYRMIRFRYWRVSYVRMEPCTTLLTAVPTSFNVTVTLIRGWHGYCSSSLASSPIGFFCCFPPAEFGIVVAAEVEATDCFFWYRRFLASTPRPGLVVAFGD